MSQKSWTAVDGYFAGLLVKPDDALNQALSDSERAGLPSISVTAAQGKLLMLLAKACGAGKILEVGTLGGYSTIWLAHGLAEGGRLITLEADARHAEVARVNIARAGLNGVVEIRQGRALDTLPRIEAEGSGPFDLIFIDADKSNLPEYFKWAVRLSHVATLIVIDNVVRKGAVLDESGADASVVGVRRMNEIIAAEPRVSATAIQTVGEKGWDGMVIAVVVA